MYKIEVQVKNENSPKYKQWQEATLANFKTLDEAITDAQKRIKELKYSYRIVDKNKKQVWPNEI